MREKASGEKREGLYFQEGRRRGKKVIFLGESLKHNDYVLK